MGCNQSLSLAIPRRVGAMSTRRSTVKLSNYEVCGSCLLTDKTACCNFESTLCTLLKFEAGCGNKTELSATLMEVQCLVICHNNRLVSKRQARIVHFMLPLITFIAMQKR